LQKSFEYGSTYEEFFQYNIAPLHSILLDLWNLDLKNLKYHEDQNYMEDYLLFLQLIRKDNSDWDGLAENVYIGTYTYDTSRDQTLAISDKAKREKLLLSEDYIKCENYIVNQRKLLGI
jgi:hypothetical protein